MNSNHSFVRVTTVSNKIVVADPDANTAEVARILEQLQSDIVLFPELNITGYTCGKLFHQKALLDSAVENVIELASHVNNELVVVGLPFRVENALYNCAAVLHDGRVIGLVPKEFIPTYNEFYEGRWFASARNDRNTRVQFGEWSVPFGTDLLFRAPVGDAHEAVVSIEICEAIWMPIPPSSFSAIAGANILLNPSASNETIGKPDYRRNLVIGQSGRCVAAYAYASCGPTESTSDLVFGGHCLIAEGGHMLVESDRVGNGKTPNRGSYWTSTDVDVEKLHTERRTTTSYNEGRRYLAGHSQRNVSFKLNHMDSPLLRKIDARPFVPKDPKTLHSRCAEIFGIQTCALAKRLEQLGPDPKVVIGISGGLDSTLSLMVAVKTFDMLGLPRKNILGITMPGFGTTNKTLENAKRLMDVLEISQKEIDIRPACLQVFKDIGHDPFGMGMFDASVDLENFTVECLVDALAHLSQEQKDKGDLVFENVQARQRTLVLMSHGFVLGTGDMSELWLGWCTFNGDHQSMYNVNCSVPKTLVKFLVEYIAETEGGEPPHQGFDGDPVYVTLMDIAHTTISPELLPAGTDGEIEQSTEETSGPYEIHDFVMFYFVRNGFSPAKILYLGLQAEGWEGEYDEHTLEHWLRVNIKRAFAQQYKRNDVPDGPKVGTVSLSPRGDWRMPSDASPAAWLRTLDDHED